MPEVHTSLRFVGTRIRQLQAAVNNDEPVRKQEASTLLSVEEGVGIDLDLTNPARPIINATGLQSIAPGTNVEIDDTDPQNPVINVVSEGATPRQTITISEGIGTLNVGKTATLLNLITTHPARIRLYATAAARSADSSRVATENPPPGAGLLFEFISTLALLGAPTSPTPIVSNADVTPANYVYYNVEPIGGAVADVTFAYIKME